MSREKSIEFERFWSERPIIPPIVWDPVPWPWLKWLDDNQLKEIMHMQIEFALKHLEIRREALVNLQKALGR